MGKSSGKPFLSAPSTIDAQKFRYAAIDLGSNEVRLDIYKAEGTNSLILVEDFDHPCMLAKGMSADQLKPDILPGSLVSAVIELDKFKHEIERRKIPDLRVRAFATEFIRLILDKNPVLGNKYIELFTTALGHPIIVIDGVEEALLLGFAAIKECQLRKREYDSIAIANIGGGSSQQSIITADGTIENATSIPYGVLTLWHESGGILQTAREIFRERLTQTFPKPDTKISGVMGGAWRAMRGLMCESPRADTIEGADAIRERLEWATGLSAEEFKLFPGADKRAEYMPLIAAMLDVFVTYTEAEQLIFMKKTMRDATAEIMHGLNAGSLNAPPPGLERLFCPSAPAQALRA